MEVEFEHAPFLVMPAEACDPYNSASADRER
jgi:hypothetical protein